MAVPVAPAHLKSFQQGGEDGQIGVGLRAVVLGPVLAVVDTDGEVARLLGPVDLEEVADRCRRLRQDLGLPARLWTASDLEQVLVSAVRDHDRPADAAVPALLAIAADPATRSPARLPYPGPWWDTPVTTQAAKEGQARCADAATSELEELERRLAETDGARVALQRRARDLLLGEGRPVTRLTVARRAVQLLEEQSPRLHAMSSRPASTGSVPVV
ncbi:hypothetical protein [Kineosporia sp. R_H_3]|uniref:hypothetical protein n=1 Tax=Kineosporia sp. R_H_3 TaxID=1961848 RepID=UPI00117A56BE|nr:hypothetical protein [Kineosporia sp. R_H_3]